MNIKISGDIIIRILLKKYDAMNIDTSSSTIRIDDFSFKKRHNYGTIIVNKITHNPRRVSPSTPYGYSIKNFSTNYQISISTSFGQFFIKMNKFFTKKEGSEGFRTPSPVNFKCLLLHLFLFIFLHST